MKCCGEGVCSNINCCREPGCTGFHSLTKAGVTYGDLCPRSRRLNAERLARYHGTAKGMLAQARAGASRRGA